MADAPKKLSSSALRGNLKAVKVKIEQYLPIVDDLDANRKDATGEYRLHEAKKVKGHLERALQGYEVMHRGLQEALDAEARELPAAKQEAAKEKIELEAAESYQVVLEIREKLAGTYRGRCAN